LVKAGHTIGLHTPPFILKLLLHSQTDFVESGEEFIGQGEQILFVNIDLSGQTQILFIII
jgi:hypothetical protein